MDVIEEIFGEVVSLGKVEEGEVDQRPSDTGIEVNAPPTHNFTLLLETHVLQ